MKLADIQALVRQSTTIEETLRLEIHELREQGDKHRTALVQEKQHNTDMRRRLIQQRNQIAQLVQFASTTTEFRDFILERVWTAGASDTDMVMAMIAAMPEVQT